MDVVVVQHFHFLALSESLIYHVHDNRRVFIHVEGIQNRPKTSLFPEVKQNIYVVDSLVDDLAEGLMVLHSFSDYVKVSFRSRIPAHKFIRVQVEWLIIRLSYHSGP